MSAGLIKGWIGVDLDGTLAIYDGWKGVEHIGAPVLPMVDRVKRWLAAGKVVKIFTARAYCPPNDPARAEENARGLAAIRAWCLEHIGQELEVTCVKDYGMIELWDDRAVQVVVNTGKSVGEVVWQTT